MDVVDPKEFLAGGMFREKDFREAVKKFDWPQFKDKPVLIQGCASILPIWAYMALMAELVPYAKSVSYGELSRPIPILGKLGQERSSFPAASGGESMDPPVSGRRG